MAPPCLSVIKGAPRFIQSIPFAHKRQQQQQQLQRRQRRQRQMHAWRGLRNTEKRGRERRTEEEEEGASAGGANVVQVTHTGLRRAEMHGHVLRESVSV
ncbi:unnamed protein product [Lampetra fluviatilis]